MAHFFKSTAGFAIGVLLAVILGASVYVYAGGYNIAADEPHWPLTHRFLRLVRDRSIAARATGVAMPDLADKDLIALGAEHYSAMCSGCHLAPGLTDSEIRVGLYPLPPNLATEKRPPAEQFWIIKHGIKMSGMPAWGKTHDDEAIWGLVAFLRQLPDLDAVEYAALTGSTGESMNEHSDHDHAEHDHGDQEPGENADEHGSHDHEKPVDAKVTASPVAAGSTAHADGTPHTHDDKTDAIPKK